MHSLWCDNIQSGTEGPDIVCFLHLMDLFGFLAAWFNINDCKLEHDITIALMSHGWVVVVGSLKIQPDVVSLILFFTRFFSSGFSPIFTNIFLRVNSHAAILAISFVDSTSFRSGHFSQHKEAFVKVQGLKYIILKQEPAAFQIFKNSCWARTWQVIKKCLCNFNY